MKLLEYPLDELDLEFILEIQNRLKQHFGDRASIILLNSGMLERMVEDPNYVYHYDEAYWVERIKNNYESRQNTVS
ncbi:hypothetical protein LH47_01794 [Anoxybacillus thermarum]|uniref:Uncharacterized protein n=1 Tax=Anoxybacillus thermarum TaxID=404937 RepID=A0A0D0RXR3_9BACL|nr:hypothetical protein [Anoxybacillus thermarum]KIQ94115.1 hypothetical protein LH47_01794 [Anoxybacillus thermarum]